MGNSITIRTTNFKPFPRLKRCNFESIGKMIDHLSMVGGIDTHDPIQPLNPEPSTPQLQFLGQDSGISWREVSNSGMTRTDRAV